MSAPAGLTRRFASSADLRKPPAADAGRAPASATDLDVTTRAPGADATTPATSRAPALTWMPFTASSMLPPAGTAPFGMTAPAPEAVRRAAVHGMLRACSSWWTASSTASELPSLARPQASGAATVGTEAIGAEASAPPDSSQPASLAVLSERASTAARRAAPGTIHAVAYTVGMLYWLLLTLLNAADGAATGALRGCSLAGTACRSCVRFVCCCGWCCCCLRCCATRCRFGQAVTRGAAPAKQSEEGDDDGGGASNSNGTRSLLVGHSGGVASIGDSAAGDARLGGRIAAAGDASSSGSRRRRGAGGDDGAAVSDAPLQVAVELAGTGVSSSASSGNQNQGQQSAAPVGRADATVHGGGGRRADQPSPSRKVDTALRLAQPSPCARMSCCSLLSLLAYALLASLPYSGWVFGVPYTMTLWVGGATCEDAATAPYIVLYAAMPRVAASSAEVVWRGGNDAADSFAAALDTLGAGATGDGGTPDAVSAAGSSGSLWSPQVLSALETTMQHGAAYGDGSKPAISTPVLSAPFAIDNAVHQPQFKLVAVRLAPIPLVPEVAARLHGVKTLLTNHLTALLQLLAAGDESTPSGTQHVAVAASLRTAVLALLQPPRQQHPQPSPTADASDGTGIVEALAAYVTNVGALEILNDQQEALAAASGGSSGDAGHAYVQQLRRALQSAVEGSRAMLLVQPFHLYAPSLDAATAVVLTAASDMLSETLSTGAFAGQALKPVPIGVAVAPWPAAVTALPRARVGHFSTSDKGAGVGAGDCIEWSYSTQLDRVGDAQLVAVGKLTADASAPIAAAAAATWWPVVLRGAVCGASHLRYGGRSGNALLELVVTQYMSRRIFRLDDSSPPSNAAPGRAGSGDASSVSHGSLLFLRPSFAVLTEDAIGGFGPHSLAVGSPVSCPSAHRGWSSAEETAITHDVVAAGFAVPPVVAAAREDFRRGASAVHTQVQVDAWYRRMPPFSWVTALLSPLPTTAGAAAADSGNAALPAFAVSATTSAQSGSGSGPRHVSLASVFASRPLTLPQRWFTASQAVYLNEHYQAGMERVQHPEQFIGSAAVAVAAGGASATSSGDVSHGALRSQGAGPLSLAVSQAPGTGDSAYRGSWTATRPLPFKSLYFKWYFERGDIVAAAVHAGWRSGAALWQAERKRAPAIAPPSPVTPAAAAASLPQSPQDGHSSGALMRAFKSSLPSFLAPFFHAWLPQGVAHSVYHTLAADASARAAAVLAANAATGARLSLGTLQQLVRRSMQPVPPSATGSTPTSDEIAASRTDQFARCKRLATSLLARPVSAAGAAARHVAAATSVVDLRKLLDTTAGFDYAASGAADSATVDPVALVDLTLKHVHKGLPPALFAATMPAAGAPAGSEDDLVSLLDCTLVMHMRLGDVAVEGWLRDVARQAEHAAVVGAGDGTHPLRGSAGQSSSGASPLLASSAGVGDSTWLNIADAYGPAARGGVDAGNDESAAMHMPVTASGSGVLRAPPAQTCANTGPAPPSSKRGWRFSTPWPEFAAQLAPDADGLSEDAATAASGSGLFSSMRSKLAAWTPTGRHVWKDWQIALSDSAQAVHDFEWDHSHDLPFWHLPHVNTWRVPAYVAPQPPAEAAASTAAGVDVDRAKKLLQAQYLLDIPENTCARDLHQALPLSFYTALATGRPIATVTEAARVAGGMRGAAARGAEVLQDAARGGAEGATLDEVLAAAFPHFSAETPWLHVHIVTEPNGLTHPLVKALAAATGASVQSSSLARDMASMLTARSLLLSTSTFSWLAADMGLARTVHFPHHGYFSSSPDKHGCLLHPARATGGKQWVYHDVLRYLLETSAARTALNAALRDPTPDADAAKAEVARRLSREVPTIAVAGDGAAARVVAEVGMEQVRQWAEFWSQARSIAHRSPSASAATDESVGHDNAGAMRRWLWRSLPDVLAPYLQRDTGTAMWNAAWDESGIAAFDTSWFYAAKADVAKRAAEAGGVVDPDRLPTCADTFFDGWVA